MMIKLVSLMNLKDPLFGLFVNIFCLFKEHSLANQFLDLRSTAPNQLNLKRYPLQSASW